jgi:hypothetical protein
VFQQRTFCCPPAVVKGRVRGVQIVPPFEGIIQLRITLPHAFEVLSRVGGIGQRGNHIDNHEPPFVVVNNAADLLALEQMTESVAGERDLPKRLTAERKEKGRDNLARTNSFPVCL